MFNPDKHYIENYDEFYLKLFWNGLEKKINRVQIIVGCIKEDKTNGIKFGITERETREKYQEDLIEYYLMIVGFEEYIVYKRPDLAELFADCRKYMRKFMELNNNL